MEIVKSEVVIIGAGLTGLSLAYYLRNSGLAVSIIEARNRLGGRILTQYVEDGAPLEAGATWLGVKHEVLNRLLEELDIGIFEQELGEKAVYEPISTSPHQIVSLPPNSDPSYRIQGGSSILIDVLAEKIDSHQIHLGEIAKEILKTKDGLIVKCEHSAYQASWVVSTLPPHLLVSTVAFQPQLPEELLAVAAKTHTWMGESIKIGLRYRQPFWRNKNSSGTIVSNVGPIPEMYDHSNYEASHYALKGFLNGSYYSVTRAERLEMVLRQLRKYYGPKVDDYLSYEENIWREEPYTYVDYQGHILPHQNNGHSVYQQAFFDGKFFIAGSETASQFPGYMDGAVRSAHSVSQKILNM